jgi:diaminohydroxyphosphoribosylaminopyrimidine deaminase/5-amino-6-(5-phosphoribosylamino)uracil reductase
MDEKIYMRRALRLAAKGWGRVSPNPMVGAVVVKRGTIIAEGYHRGAGKKHAEVEALDRAGLKAGGAALYINMEPCVHYGRTPPCVDRIISAGIKKAIIGMEDPNPLVSGKGIAKLEKAGIRTEVGLLQEEAEKLNEIFIKHITTGKPFVTVKAAMSLDGKISTGDGDSRWITGEKARRLVHKIRSGVDGILVGVNTVIKDDPQLTVRYGMRSHQPMKIIVDSKCRIPLSARVLSENPSNVIVATTSLCKKCEKLREAGARVLRVRSRGGRVDLAELMRELGSQNVTSVLVEGGGEIIASAVFSGIADRVLFFIAPMIIGGRDALTPVEGKGISRISSAIKVNRMKVRRIGEDILVEGYLNAVSRET